MNCNAEWVRNALYLRQHACGLDSENQADRLTLLPIKSELLSVRYAMAHELSTICPCDRLGERNSIITDSIEADESSTAGPIQMLAQASVGLFGLVVIVHTDKPIKDLPHRKRQIGSILAQYGLDLGKEVEGKLLWPPRCEATDTSCNSVQGITFGDVGH